MAFKVKLAKIIMRIFSTKPQYDITQSPRSETINHNNFLKADDWEKRRILFKMAESHFLCDRKKPFDLFFPNHLLRKLLHDKKVLDIGCWCGGESVSFTERWAVQSMHGIDINQLFLRAATLFSSTHCEKGNSKYFFVAGVVENLPYKSESFDAIVSRDVFEHVHSLPQAIMECKRVLKPRGILLSVFPSYYFPLGGAHLDFVTNAPCIQWFFDSETLNVAYEQIMDARGEETYWYRSKTENNSWQKLHGGIGINGVTFSTFKSIIRDASFSQIYFVPTPLLCVSDISVNHPIVKHISKLLTPIFHNGLFQEYFSHRIVSILIK